MYIFIWGEVDKFVGGQGRVTGNNTSDSHAILFGGCSIFMYIMLDISAILVVNIEILCVLYWNGQLVCTPASRTLIAWMSGTVSKSSRT